MPTFQDIIAKVQTRIPGVPSAFALAELNDVHKLVLASIPDLRMTTEASREVIALVNDTRYYTLEPDWIQISSVWLKSGSTYTLLTPTTYQQLASHKTADSGFFYQASGAVSTITRYAIIGDAANTSGAISLAINSKPNPASGAELHVYGTRVESTTTTSTAISAWLTTDWSYVEGLSWRCAIRYSPGNALAYFQSFQAALSLERGLAKTWVEGMADTARIDRNVRMEGAS